ncbi:MAG: PorT family protein [Bdellovibrionales bacterium]|nr:PorT family protein [Bdellovibrionales bacterium]
MNKLFLLSILSLISVSAHAQTETINISSMDVQTNTPANDQDSELDENISDDRIAIEIRGGFNTNAIASQNSSDSTNKAAGASGSVTVNLPIGDTTSTLNTGLSFVQRGAEAAGNHATIDYLVLPALLQANIGHVNAVRWNVGVGPYFGLKLATSGINSSNLKTLDLGMRGATGVEFPMDSTYSLLVGVTYDWGATDISANGAQIHNQGWCAGFGLGIYL